MKDNDRKVRNILRQFPVPPCDPDKMRQTVQLSEKAYRERLLSKRIGLWEFIRMQVRFIGRWVWVAQAVFWVGFFLFFSRYQFGRANMQPVFLLFSAVAPLIAFVGFPEILKSYSHNMEEIEACTRFSMQKLMGARMLILGLTDLCSLTLILAAATADNAALILRMILYLFVPFNLTCGACLTVLDHVKNRYAGTCCGAVCVTCMAIFCRLSLQKGFYEIAATGGWIVLFILSAMYFAIEIVRVFRSFHTICCGDETLSVTW